MSEEETYIVRLLFEVPARNHQGAVARVIDQLSRHGILDWVYRSQRLSDGEYEHYNGDLEFVDLEVIRQRMSNEDVKGIENDQD